MKYCFRKLIPPRTNFVQTLTRREGKLMQEHAAYWKGMNDGPGTCDCSRSGR